MLGRVFSRSLFVRIHILLFPIILLFVQSSKGEVINDRVQGQLDSLSEIVNNSSFHDTMRLNAQLELIRTLYRYDVNIDSILPKYIAIADYLQEKIRQHPRDYNIRSRIKTLGKVYKSIGIVFHEKSKSDSALMYYYRAEKIAQFINDKIMEARIIMYIGAAQQAIGDLDLAHKILRKSLKKSIILNDMLGVSETLNFLGLNYLKKDNDLKAMRFFHKSMDIKESNGIKKGLGNVYGNLGDVFTDQQEHQKAIEFLNRAIVLHKEEDNSYSRAIALNNIGLLYADQNNTDKAMEYFNQSLELNKKIGNKDGIANTLISIGQIFYRKKELKIALEYALRCLEIREELGHKLELTNVLINLGFVYAANGEYEKATYYAKRGLEIAKEIGSPSLISGAAYSMSYIYEKQNKAMKSLEFYELYIQMRDSISNKENQKAVLKQQAKYEIEKKDREIVLSAKDKELKEAKLEQAQLIRNGLAVGFLLFVGGVGIVVFNYKKKQKIKQLVIEKSEAINKQRARMNGQEQERKRMARELHDGLGGTLAAIKLNLNNVNSKVKNPRITPIISTIDHVYHDVRNLSHDLMPLAFKEIQLIPAIKNYVDKVKRDNNFKVRVECFPEDDLNELPDSIQLDVYRIVQELVNNIVKHANATIVDIALSIENDQIDLIVEDNGTGFDRDTTKKGMGLKNIESRVKLLDGKMHIDTKENKGSAFHIHFVLEKEGTKEILL